MAKKVFCFDILALEEGTEVTTCLIEVLEEAVKGFYIFDGDDAEDPDLWKNAGDLPFMVTYTARPHHRICINLTSTAKKNLDIIEAINASLTDEDLQFEDFKLSVPYEFGTDPAAWHTDGAAACSDGKKWRRLVQQGPYFPHLMKPYEPKGGYILYDKRPVYLTPEEEEVALLYAGRILSDAQPHITVRRTKNKTFNKNFWTDFQEYLSKEHKFMQNFNMVDWTPLVSLAAELKEKKKNRSKEEKDQEKREAAQRKREYGTAMLDGRTESIGSAPLIVGIFLGGPDNPKAGRIRKRIEPEDVTINKGPDDPIPSPPEGRKWKAVVTDQCGEWLAKWQHSITGEINYLRFGADGTFKGQSDLKKYEKARKLHKNIDDVRAKYMADLEIPGESISAQKLRQLGMVVWLIDNQGIRPGDERDEDQTDTVGASTLRVEHIKVLPPKPGKTEPRIAFDFAGKDGVVDKRQIEAPQSVADVLQKILAGKGRGDQVFDKISAADINNYLQQIDSSFSSKVFRTRKATSLMMQELNKLKKIKAGTTSKEIKLQFNKANQVVAEALNHIRTATAKQKESVAKLEKKIKGLKKQKKEAGTETAQKALAKKIKTASNSLKLKRCALGTSLTTSLINYIDPRLVVSWANEQADPEAILKAVYSPTLQRKFLWAIESTKDDWNWATSELEDELEELSPADTTAPQPANAPPAPGGQGGPPTKQEVRAWCRNKWGTEWYAENKEARKQEAKDAIRAARDARPKSAQPSEPTAPEPKLPEPATPAPSAKVTPEKSAQRSRKTKTAHLPFKGRHQLPQAYIRWLNDTWGAEWMDGDWEDQIPYVKEAHAHFRVEKLKRLVKNLDGGSITEEQKKVDKFCDLMQKESEEEQLIRAFQGLHATIQLYMKEESSRIAELVKKKL